jgi:hypothetical protein
VPRAAPWNREGAPLLDRGHHRRSTGAPHNAGGKGAMVEKTQLPAPRDGRLAAAWLAALSALGTAGAILAVQPRFR